ncbi:hypothetical protein K2173_012904 (mitochondrion) [Erythroxylum novogranatense]|uniref:Uncharacterized protein n=1 Tax=Erythroxylum novogranatense TaxID=1862640 RepID=A0AAV8S445_9ROSI|nr:hypothetical protein K2173_012904 [Erythroxylum novogranatense]
MVEKKNGARTEGLQFEETIQEWMVRGSGADSSSSSLPSISSTGDSWIHHAYGNQGEGPSAAPNPGQQPQGAPEASTGTSSTLSGSRVERWLYPDPEVSSSVRNEEQPQGGEAPNLPMGVMGPEAPSIDFLRTKIVRVFRSITRGHRQPRADFRTRIEEDIGLPTASPEKRLKIPEVLEALSSNPEQWDNSCHRAAIELRVLINDWEREQSD